MGARMKRVVLYTVPVAVGTFCALRFRERTVRAETPAGNELHKGSNLSTTGEKLTLKQAQIFFRHGARTPIKHLPGVEEVNYDKRFLLGVVPHAEIPHVVVNMLDEGSQPGYYFEGGKFEAVVFKGGIPQGRLTKLGKEQGYMLGMKLKRRYVEDTELISPQFKEEEIFVRTSNVRRTVGTLEGVLAGMFGAGITKEAIRMNTLDSTNEFIYPNGRECRTLHKIVIRALDYVTEHPAVLQMKSDIKEHLGEEAASKISGFEFQNWRDHVIARKTHGLPVPEWMEKCLPGFIKAGLVSHKAFACGAPSDRDLTLSITAGPLLGMVHKYMAENIAQSSDSKKMCLYSCHDTTLTPLLTSLGITLDDWPPYTADVRFELFVNSTDQHFVKIYYCGQEMIPPHLESPLIPYAEFVSMIKPYEATFEQYKQRCTDVPQYLRDDTRELP